MEITFAAGTGFTSMDDNIPAAVQIDLRLFKRARYLINGRTDNLDLFGFN